MALGASLIFKSLVLNQSCNCTSMDTGQSTIWTDCLTPSLLRYQFILLWLGDIGNRMWETFLRFLCSIDWTWNWSQYALQYPLSCATVPVLLCTGQILRFSADVKCCHNELLHFACERYWCCVTWKCVHVCVCVCTYVSFISTGCMYHEYDRWTGDAHIKRRCRLLANFRFGLVEAWFV